jgi:uncharacterized RDD family membrane protein YckC
MISEQAPPASRPSAGVFRRLGAMFYDLLLIIALMMVFTAALLPFTGGEAVLGDRYGALEYAYQVMLVLIVIGFFGGFWTKRGQTLGMAAWRMKIERVDGSLLTWSDAFKRLGAAAVSLCLAGVGYFWIWVDKDKLAWPDRWTNTRVVVAARKQPKV